MATAREARALLVDASYLDGDTVDRVGSEHEFTEYHAGDGYTEPREAWIDCSCGINVWAWQQYYMESGENPEYNKKMHLAMMLVEAVLNEGKEKN